MRHESELRTAIRELVAEFFQARHGQQKPFVPGTTPVRYAGRVFDQHELQNAIDACLDFWLTRGRFAESFEEKLAETVGVDFAFLVNSGSSANLLAVSSLTSPLLGSRRLRPGDEVLTVAAGFPTTVNPIVQNSLVPVFVDVEIGTYNVLVSGLESAVSDRTRAIFLAHTLGNPFDIGAVLEIAERYGLFVIEDCCDALGSLYDDRPVGCFGLLSTCSFYPAHHITTGEGGAVLTNDERMSRAVRSLRDWGRDCYCAGGESNTCGIRFTGTFGRLPRGYDHKYVYSHLGYNLNATDIQAAIGVAQLEKLDQFCASRRHNFRSWLDGLSGFEEHFELPRATARSDPSWFAFPLTVRPQASFTRTDLTAHLQRRHIETRNLFAGNLLHQPAYEGVVHRVATSLENTNRIAHDTFFLGTYPGLDAAQVGYALEVINEFVRSR